MRVPAGISDQAAVSLSCNLPTALIANKLAAVMPGESVALIGCGPTGLMALDIVFGAAPGLVVALDPIAHRRDLAASKGAIAIDSGAAGWTSVALDHTDGRGFDKVIEMVGYTESLQMALDLIRPGGTIAALGVFTDVEFTLNPLDVFLRDITLHMNGFANVQPFMWDALRLIERGVVNPGEYVNQTFSLENIDQAFVAFDNKSDGINKVLITP
jgi:alcohol dehydrogenase